MYSVLIVDDDPMVAMINEGYVNRHKDFYVVAKCGDGNSALDFLSNNDVDLIFLDVFMPYMDGFETLRRIREQKINSDVIMVTAANERDALRESIQLGVIDYLVKPFTFERFRLALDKFIAQTDALKALNTVNQKSIDSLFTQSGKGNLDLFPKGIQKNTLHLIKEKLENNEWMTGEEIAEKTGLTTVTVRRYMTYLTEAGIAESEMNYETGGRPGVVYRIVR